MLVLTELAKEDVLKEEAYLIKEASFEIADRFTLAFSRTLDQIESMPTMYQRSDIQPFQGYELRQAGFWNHKIFYLLAHGDAVILRVLHNRRDYTRLLKKYSLQKYYKNQ